MVVRKTERVIAYIDGYNFYHGLKEGRWERYLWLDLPKFVQNLLKDNQKLETTKYFTTRISGPESSRKRQSTFLEALQLRGNLDIYFGKFQVNPRVCNRCRNITYVPNEKMTDVNIAVQMMTDAFNDDFDTALVISADSDLVPPIEAIKNLRKDKRIVVAFPPNRFSEDLRTAATASFHINRVPIAKSLLPDTIQKSDGFILERPRSWR